MSKKDAPKVVPFLWFNNNAEEAVDFYASVFKNFKIGKIFRYDSDSAKVSGQPEGSVMTIYFTLEGMDFGALNGGPMFTFSSAVSFLVNCETQEEIDGYWEKLSAGGEPMDCGWVKDKFGVTWQIAPRILDEFLADPDREKAGRVMRAMLKMKKMEIEPLKQAYEETP